MIYNSRSAIVALQCSVVYGTRENRSEMPRVIFLSETVTKSILLVSYHNEMARYNDTTYRTEV